MPVERDGLNSTKGRTVPIDPDGIVVSLPDTNDLLREILLEIRAVRFILAEAFDVNVDPEELEE